MMTYTILVLNFLSTCLARPTDDHTWREYKLKFKKVYAEDEEATRYEIWNENVKEILMHNVDSSTSYEQGVNQFTDMTFEEFEQKMGAYVIPPESGSVTSESEDVTPAPSNVALPSFVNWTSKGYVTGVKNQGTTCNSCYAFSATGAMEGQWAKKYGYLPNLSEQQIIDCSPNLGCKFGWLGKSWKYIKDAGGSETENSYPYEAKQGKCRFKSKYVVANSSSYNMSWPNDENVLKKAVATIGPISVGVDSRHTSFKNYKRGVYYEPKCGNTKKYINHLALVVGYGTEGGFDYWLVKNSWGTQWGESGYVKMRRNFHNNCAIAVQIAYPLV